MLLGLLPGEEKLLQRSFSQKRPDSTKFVVTAGSDKTLEKSVDSGEFTAGSGGGRGFTGGGAMDVADRQWSREMESQRGANAMRHKAEEKSALKGFYNSRAAKAATKLKRPAAAVPERSQKRARAAAALKPMFRRRKPAAGAKAGIRPTPAPAPGAATAAAATDAAAAATSIDTAKAALVAAPSSALGLQDYSSSSDED